MWGRACYRDQQFGSYVRSASAQPAVFGKTHQEKVARTRVRRVRDDFWLVTSDV
jgi:hypothetical protein